MKKKLVLAEKPSVGRDLARVLECNKKGNGYMEGEKYIVTWALGHLVTLKEPEKYNKKYKTWSIEDLPMLPSPLETVVMKKTKKQFNIIKGLMNRKDISQVIIATDAGREGELVARWVIKKAYIKKPIKRLWISSVTDKAIKDGFNNLKNGKDYENLYLSAVARAEADWYVGMNATRALTCKYNAQLSAGRVQTPTLAIIDKKNKEIKNYKSKTYYKIVAESNGLKLIWKDKFTNDTKIFNKNKSEKIIKNIKDKKAKIIRKDKVHKKSYPPKLYDLTELQRDANKYFDFSANETLSIMQKLYERHKLLTYPRTDSRYITTDMVDTLKDRIKACSIKSYKKYISKIINNPIKASKSFVDNKKVSDHHAIIPTEEVAIIDSLSNKERKIYDLVVKRFLAILYPPCEYEQITVEIKIGDEIFTTTDKIIKSLGWKEIHDKDTKNLSKDIKLFKVNKGETIDIKRVYQTKGETKPPAHFNEGTLLSAMENPKKYMDNENKDLIKTIGETKGLGTVATRASIIEKLYRSYLIEKKGKSIFVTSKGRQLLDLVPKDLKSPELTAELEQKLSDISKGSLNKEKFINEMKNYSKAVVKKIKGSEKDFKHDNLTRNRCPECNKYMLEIKNKNGRMLVCQDRECGYKKGFVKKSNARCPNCHKKMELKGTGKNKIFVCKCGYREKLTAFKKRKNSSKKVSKKEVNKYLKKQKKEKNEPINTALADALSKLNLD